MSGDFIASSDVTTVTEDTTNSNIEKSLDTEETSKSGLENQNEDNDLKETKNTRTDDVNTKVTNDITNNQVIDASKEVQTFVQNNHELPNDISVNGKQVTMNEFLYLVSQTLINVNKEDYAGVDYLELPEQSINTNNMVSGTLTKNQYLSLCTSIIDFIKTNNIAPDTRGISLGIIQFKSMVYHLATALNTYSTTGKLPDSLNIDDSVFEKSSVTKFSAAGETPIIFTVAQITVASEKVVNYVKKHNKLPNSVTIGKTKVNTAEYLYLVAKLVSNLKKGNTKAITYLKLPKVTDVVSKHVEKRFSTAAYVSTANKILTYIKVYNKAPSAMKTSVGIVDFRVLTYDLAKVAKSYGSNHKLIKSIQVNSTIFIKKPTKFTVAQIGKAGKTIDKYVIKHKKLPKTVKIGKTKVNMAEYLYLASKLTVNIKKNKTGPITYIKMALPSTVVKNVERKLYKSAYVSTAKKIISYMNTKKQAPITVKTKVGIADFNLITYSFVKIARSYKNKHKLPSYVKLYSSQLREDQKEEKVSNASSLTLKEIFTLASKIETSVDDDGYLPEIVSVNNKKVIMADLLDVFAQSVINFNKKVNSISINVKNLKYNNFTSSKSITGDIIKEDYVNLAKSIEDYINKHNKTPNVLDTSIGKMQFRTMLYTLSKLITSYKKNSKLPSSVSVSDSVFIDISKKKYLVATKNCQVNNAKIKNLAKSLTSGLKTNLAKAKKIFNYVRDSVTYSFYFNTRRGALKTLTSKRGNCVDTAHLVVALCRAAKLPARYVHADCTFRSGRVIGHVWAEIYVNGKWLKADGTSNYNTLGKIVNWHKGVYHGRYISLPF